MKSSTFKKRRRVTGKNRPFLLPICAGCGKTRTPGADPKLQESWIQVDTDLKRVGKRITHSLCPDCMRRHYSRGFAE